MAKNRYDLTFDEMIQARKIFSNHAEEYITTTFQMRTILSELGQYPADSELHYCLESFDNKVSFNTFCNYLMYLKSRFNRPEPRDADTLRAFMALGGASDRAGDISTDDLRTTVKHFDLTIDIDAMLREVDEDQSGSIDYSEFAAMWKDDDDEQMEPQVVPLARKTSSFRREEERGLDEGDNLAVVKTYLFPLQRKTSEVAPLTKRKSNATRKSMANLYRLPSLYPTSNTAPRKSDVGLADDVESEEEEEEKQSPARAQPRGSIVGYRPPSPVILDFRRSRGRTKLPQLTPRVPAPPPRESTGRTPRTARTRY